MKASEVLRKAKAKIEDESKWCRDHDAVDAHGKAVKYDDPNAVAWCAFGATGSDGLARADELLDDAANLRFGVTANEVNDEYGHAAVMDLYTLAIELAEDEEAQETTNV